MFTRKELVLISFCLNERIESLEDRIDSGDYEAGKEGVLTDEVDRVSIVKNRADSFARDVVFVVKSSSRTPLGVQGNGSIASLIGVTKSFADARKMAEDEMMICDPDGVDFEIDDLEGRDLTPGMKTVDALSGLTVGQFLSVMAHLGFYITESDVKSVAYHM